MNSKEELINRIQYLKINKFNYENYEKYKESKKNFLQQNLGNNFFNKLNNLKKEFIDIYLD